MQCKTLRINEGALDRTVGWIKRTSFWVPFFALVAFVEILVALMNTLMSYVWWGRFSGDLVIIGVVDTAVIAPIPFFIIFYIVGLLRKADKEAEEELMRSKEELEARVQERTADISRAALLLDQRITQQRKVEAELRKSEKLQKAILDNIPDIAWLKDRESRFIAVNGPFGRACGLSPAELAGKTDLDIWPRELAEKYISDDMEVIRTGVHKSVEETLIDAAGNETWIETVKTPIFNEDMEVLGTTGISRDITRRKRAEEDAARARNIESLSILAGGIAHDFNNILTAVLGNISIALMSVKPGDELADVLKAAEKAAIKAKGLTHQLLTFTKGGSPVKTTASVSELIREMSGFALSGSNVKCVLSLPEDLMPVEVDEAQFGSVLQNMLLNAAQAMPDGGHVSISAENVEIAGGGAAILPEGMYVKVSISDDGVGIPPDDLPKIFDPYFTTKPGGCGIGLASAYSIIRKHNGHIFAESRPGQGTTFHIHLPASVRKPLPKGGDIIGPACHGCRILVLDDDSMVRDALGLMLKLLGHDARLTATADEAVERYREAESSGRPFDVVLMDLTIPGGPGGKEAVKRLIEIDPAVRAIVSSGYSHDPVMSEYIKYGFCGVITKPFEINELARALNLAMTG